ncbi:MAG: hypothetical protein RBT41_02575 [Clostridia bacterium]|nr:hypothetical protein [Clostridia bacterium]
MEKVPKKYLVVFLVLSLLVNAQLVNKLYIAQNYEKVVAGNQIVAFVETLESLTVRIDKIFDNPDSTEDYAWLIAKSEVLKSTMLLSDRSYKKLAPAILTLGDQVYQITIKYFYRNDNAYTEEELLVLNQVNHNLKEIVHRFNQALNDSRTSPKTLLDYEADLSDAIFNTIGQNEEELSKLL